MTDHIWTQENLDAYLADGLPDEERTALEQHLADCAECAQSLKDARKLETTMKDLFADAAPAAGLEERALARLRSQPIAYPLWRRYLVGAAAVLLLGLIGAVVQAVVADGGARVYDLQLFAVRESTFKTVGSKIGSASGGSGVRQHGFLTADVDPTAKESDTDIQYMNERTADMSVPGSVNPNQAIGIMDGDKGAAPVNLPAPGGFGKAGQGGAFEGAPIGGIEGGRGPNGQPLGEWAGQRSILAYVESPDKKRESPPSASMSKGSAGYFKPGSDDGKPKSVAMPAELSRVSPPPASVPMPQRPKSDDTVAMLEQAKKDAGPPKDGPPPPPDPAGRKIIRTGEMEFEVESFDAAVAGVGKLLETVKGGFIATVNSDKLPNGKMRGAVVVRMPPQFLDKFLFDVRGALGKNSELKHQRIGSADVSKQYTDIESRLRAARTLEDRLIKIIQTGKGEVKDLVAAERELGVWRTKIEEMEGEIRYYNNQVALSTLTIKLTEREISTPFALVTSEKVQMRLEVEEVGKALEAAIKMVDQFKGRVVKSESKQFKAGQIEAVLQAEVPSAVKESFRKELRKLGLVSEDESTQKTQSEGGSGKPGKLEPKVLDTVFEVTLNNIVNIPPRNSVNLDVASNDVAAAYARLEAFVLKKGQMRVSSKSEPDKQRVTAYLEFNVPSEYKDEADKLVAAVGPVLKATNVQMPITEVATSQKFGYKLSLYSVATIAPRETVKLTIQVDDVAARAAEIEALGRLNKGQIEKGRFLQNPQGTTTTVVALRVPMPVADALVGQFMKMGKQVIEREQTPNPNAPENDLATTAVIVTLTGGSPIVPSDQGLGTQISKGLYWAFWAFCMCMIFIVSGLAFVVPIAVTIWIAVKVIIWLTTTTKKPVVVTAPKVVEAVAPNPTGNG